MTVAVLGGGPAGLYAALLLARRGIDVTVFEGDERFGGLAAGMAVDGQSVDHGSHRLHPSIDADILADLRRMLGSGLQERVRRGRIRLGDAWLPFPLSGRAVLNSLPAATLVRLGVGGLAAMLRPTRRATFSDVVATGLGRPMGDVFYFPYARKIWGLDPDMLSGEQARRRIGADSPFKLVRKALAPTAGRRFYYAEAGFGAIPDAIAGAASRAGVRLYSGQRVVGLRRSSSRWEVETAGGTNTAELVLSTIPVSVLARLLGPPASVEQALSGMRSRAMVLLYLTVPSPRWTEYDAHYFPAADVPFTRISEPKNYRDSPADPPDRSVICVEMPCDPGDPLWEADGAALTASVRDAVTAMGLPDPGARATVKRLRHAYPVYRLGADEALAQVQTWLSGIPALVTFGRQGLFAHDNTHHALAMARDAANAVSASLQIDEAAWNAAQRRFTRHVVED